MRFKALFSSKVTVDKAEHPLKTFDSIVVTAAGSVISCRRRLLLNASVAMLLTVVGNLIAL